MRVAILPRLLLPVRPPSRTYLGLGVMMSLTSGTACTFPVSSTGTGRRHFLLL